MLPNGDRACKTLYTLFHQSPPKFWLRDVSETF